MRAHDPSAPSLAVAIPTRNRPRHLAALLAALRAQQPDAATLPVVCCDDGSEHPLASSLTPPDGVRILRHARSRGPAAARNTAWRTVEADWIWFLDDDVLPETGAVRAMLAAVAGAGAEVGIIDGPVRAADGPADQLASPLVPRVPEGDGSHRLTANIVYRRAALDAVGGVDEGFRTAACEDFDLAFRVEDAGWRHMSAPGAVVRHAVHPADTASMWLRRRREGRAAVVRLYSRHPARFGPSWVDRYGALIHRRGRTPGPASFVRFFVAEALLDALAARRWWRRPHLIALWWVLAAGAIAGTVRDAAGG
ncbi:MAG: glycosyltransferase family 2 protein, partial [Vicinamibacterales bacterium]